MDPHSDRAKEPLRSDVLRMSTVSSIGDDLPVYHDEASQHELRARASLVSLQSQHPTPYETTQTQHGDLGEHLYSPAPSWSASFGYSATAGSYAPLGGAAASSKKQSSRRFRSKRRQAVPESIPEEFDMALLQSAAAMGVSPLYEALPEGEETPMVAGFDLQSAAGGPTTPHDADFLKLQQDREAQGTLTGGLGQGIRSNTLMRGTDLLASPTTVGRSLTRSLTRRRSGRPFTRRETIQHRGQEEADRRGEVIEVIMEDQQPLAHADLSNIEGSDMVWSPQTRRSTMTGKEGGTQIFYPQPNWKPFSMHWPYLTVLVVLSIALAAMQEILFRKYRDRPLLTFQKPSEVEPGFYFAIKFAPTIAAVVYGVLWQFLDFEVRRLEAYYQLSKRGGALAAESINVDYVTSFNFLRPFRALKLGQYAVFFSSVATILAISLVPTFASASIVLQPSREQRLLHPTDDKFLNFSPVWSRLLTSTLAVCSACGILLLYLLQRRRTGLLSDVHGIAGLASMAVVSHILMDFKDMDTAKHKIIHQKLKYNRYMLRNSSLAPDDDNPVSKQEKSRYERAHLPENPHPLMFRAVGFVPFVVGLCGFMGFVPAFLFTNADVVTDKAPWFVTAVAVILKMCWTSLETAVRMMEPYYILSKRHAPAKTLILDYTALPFGYLPFRALLNGHLLVFFVGFGTVLVEFLTILVTGLATVDGQSFVMIGNDDGSNSSNSTAAASHAQADKDRLINSGQETVLSFYVSFCLSVFILLYMSVVTTVVYFRRRHPFLPRQPNTIASVLAFIHQSKMLYEFVGTEKMNRAEMARKLDDGKTYGLGWFQGRDGQIHCGIDNEELTSYYKHGVDYTKRNEPWNIQWDRYD